MSTSLAACHLRPRPLCIGLKAYTTSYTADALSKCREACGGHGYAAVNRLGALRSDHDIFQTFEGAHVPLAAVGMSVRITTEHVSLASATLQRVRCYP